MFIELNRKKDKTGRRAFTVILHEIHSDDCLVDNTGTEHNRNGITWIRKYVEPHLETIHGMSLTVEFTDEERSQIFGHGETDLVGGDDGLPLFENATVVGYFEKGWIDTVNVNGEDKTVVLGSGYIDEMRYPKFVKWLVENVNNGGTVYGSIEFFKKEGNDSIVYLDGYKEKGRVPTEYMYSGFALLDILAPADNTATLLEINTLKNSKEENKMDEKALSQFVSDIKSAVIETNSKNAEYEATIIELNTQIAEKDAKIVELNASVEQLQEAIKKMDEEHQTYWAERDVMIQELAKARAEKRISELNSALDCYSETEREYAKTEIDTFMADPENCGIEINTITTLIKARSYDEMKAQELEVQKKAEINSAGIAICDIFGAIDDDGVDTTDSGIDFNNMFN